MKKKSLLKTSRSYPMIPAKYPNLQGTKDCSKKTPLTWDTIHSNKDTIDKRAWVNSSKNRGFLKSCTSNILLVILRFNISPAEVRITLMTFCHNLILWASVGNCGSSLLPSHSLVFGENVHTTKVEYNRLGQNSWREDTFRLLGLEVKNSTFSAFQKTDPCLKVSQHILKLSLLILFSKWHTE